MNTSSHMAASTRNCGCISSLCMLTTDVRHDRGRAPASCQACAAHNTRRSASTRPTHPRSSVPMERCVQRPARGPFGASQPFHMAVTYGRHICNPKVRIYMHGGMFNAGAGDYRVVTPDWSGDQQSSPLRRPGPVYIQSKRSCAARKCVIAIGLSHFSSQIRYWTPAC